MLSDTVAKDYGSSRNDPARFETTYLWKQRLSVTDQRLLLLNSHSMNPGVLYTWKLIPCFPLGISLYLTSAPTSLSSRYALLEHVTGTVASSSPWNIQKLTSLASEICPWAIAPQIGTAADGRTINEVVRELLS